MIHIRDSMELTMSTFSLLGPSWSGAGVCAAAFVLVYAAFQAHMLPPAIARVVGRVCFYPTYPLTYWQRRRDMWTLVDSHVVLGAAPMGILGHVDQLYARGVRAVVNLCDEYAGPVAAYKKRHITQLYLPTIVRTLLTVVVSSRPTRI